MNLYRITKPTDDRLSSFYQFLFGNKQWHEVALSNETFFPFKIQHVNGKIPVDDYISLMKDLKIPLCTKDMFHHDMLNHILPTKYVIEHVDNKFMYKMEQIIRKGNDVDYLTFEFVSFILAYRLSGNTDDPGFNTIGPMLKSLLRSKEKSDILMNRWNRNYEFLTKGITL